MPLLFSYGTLQLEAVQRSTFGRVLKAEKDELPAFVLGRVPIEDPAMAAALGMTHHANVVYNARNESRVAGTVLEVTDAELAAADKYEAPAKYVRIAVTLASGRQCWVYVDARSASGTLSDS